MRDIKRSVAIGIPPFKFDNSLVAQVGNQIEEMMRNDQRGRGASLALSLARDGTQRLSVQVIEVRVRHEDDVHRRQVSQVQSRLAQSFQDEEPACKVRIDNDVLPAYLQKKAGVPDECNAQFTVRDQFRLVGLARARRYRRVPYQASELAGPLAQCRVFQRGL